MTAPAPFSVVVLEGDHESLPLPELGPYFVATKDGYFVHRNFHFGRVLMPTKQAIHTPPMVPTLWATIDRLPAPLLGQAYSFFRAIYIAKKSEAMVYIVYTRERGYRLFVPPQQAHGGGVKAIRTPEHIRGQVVGTIHSHCDFSAFHSGTDKHDADGHDGLHITIGDVMKEQPSIAAMIAVSGITWDLTLDEYCDGPLAVHPHPAWWERYVEQPQNASGLYDGAFGGTPAWKPKAAVAPSKNTPTVIGTPPGGTKLGERYLSIEELMWRLDTAFTDDEQAELEQASKFLDAADMLLSRLDIDFRYELVAHPENDIWATDDDAFNDRRTAP